MLRIENLVKRYGKFYAVNGLNLHIGHGEIFGFVGPNGAGKTTTIKIVSGLLDKTSGEVFVNGMDITKKIKEYKKFIGYMPDFFGVYDDLKVTEYLDFYAGVYGIPRTKRMDTTDRLLELVNLSDKRNSYVDDLSRGMKQRLCLARSLIHEPDLLILDEPASGLDPRARIEMKEILKELKDMGKTIIISSHILPELAEMCTSIGVIENGKMIVNGLVSDIMKQVKTKKVIRITAISQLSEIVAFLKEQVNIDEINVNDEKIEFSFLGNDEELAFYLKSMVERDFRILSFHTLEKNLESIFLHLIGGDNDGN